MELHHSGELAVPVTGTSPRVARTPMAPRPWDALRPTVAAPRDVRGFSALEVAAARRRFVLLVLSLAPALYATALMSDLLPITVNGWLQGTLLALFALLSCWVAAGFWTAMAGLWVSLRGGDEFLISRSAASAGPLPPDARTAIVMPICNEDVRHVFAGLRATYESLARSGELERFDFFVLSDSSDPDTCVAELDAWAGLRETLDAEDRLFYRRRTRRVKRKSGNIDDFCRRWGGNYRYMIVLDADSVMTGECLVTLARLMEARPDAGIIQTAPQAVGRNTFHARAQQFANQVYGPLFTAGLHYWQLGESHYWGHNAIIRLAPFMRHCALAPLPGRGALSGEILSHDFVEAALMRRAGYGVWIAYDLDGSYEQTPPNLLDEIKRDRRSCQGNLMNARLMFLRGLHPVHRTVFFTGALAYLSAPLWLSFLALSTWLLVQHGALVRSIRHARSAVSAVTSWRPEHAVGLAVAVAILLFLPKLLAALLASARGASRYGGASALAMSTLVEIVLSALLAPCACCSTRSSCWPRSAARRSSGRRRRARMKYAVATKARCAHGARPRLGLHRYALVAIKAPDFLPWLAPVAAGLILAVPLSVWTSRTHVGLAGRRLGYLTPRSPACHARLPRPSSTRAAAALAALCRCRGRSGDTPRWCGSQRVAAAHLVAKRVAKRATGACSGAETLTAGEQLRDTR